MMTMPIYDYQCKNCGKVPDIRAGIYDTEASCPYCHTTMNRLFSPPKNIICDIEPFLDENMGHEPVYVRSRREHKRLLKERGLVQIG